MSVPPYREALEVARMAGFSPGELDLYDRAKIAEQDARGALSLAERQGREEGREEGRAEGLREAIRALCQAFEIEIDAEREAPPGRHGSRRAEGAAGPLVARAALELRLRDCEGISDPGERQTASIRRI